MAHTYQTQLEAARNTLTQAISDVQKQLAHPDLSTIRTGTVAHLERAANRLNGLMLMPLTGNHADSVPEAQPITHVFGKPIGRKAPVSPQDYTVSDAEKDEFLTKRDEFLTAILNMSNVEVGTYSEYFETVVRSSAKLAGILDYATVGINSDVIDAIRSYAVKRATIGEAEAATLTAASETTVVETTAVETKKGKR